MNDNTICEPGQGNIGITQSSGLDRHAVFSRQRVDVFQENDVVSTESARQHNTSTFDGAKLQSCQLINAQAEHCSFRNAFIVMTDIEAASTKHSNFTGATISKYSVPKDEPFALVDESQGFSMTM